MGMGVVSASAQEISQAKWLKNMKAINPNIRLRYQVDEAAIKAAGIQKLSGKHLDLYTDVRDDSIKELVDVFDKSVSQWCQIFDVKPEKAAKWRMRVFLVADSKNTKNFQRAGVMPNDLPLFLAGFQRDHDFWLFLQPSEYYTRHLLIHEGTHAFMQWFLNGYGAPWYSEGVAELVGFHSWKDSNLKLKYRARDRVEADGCARVRRLKRDWDANNLMSLGDVLAIPPKAFLDVRFYAWSWAGCDFFSRHPKTKKAFQSLKQNASIHPTEFNVQFQKLIRPDWVELQRDWLLFLSEAEYGYEVERGLMTEAKSAGGSKFEIKTNYSWQTTSVQVKKGDRFKISSKGEFKIGPHPFAFLNMNRGMEDETLLSSKKPWRCQSNGITIDYYRKQPLGMLIGGVFNPAEATPHAQLKGLIDFQPIGLSREIVASQDGVLCLRINESPAHLGDNEGVLHVVIEKLK